MGAEYPLGHRRRHRRHSGSCLSRCSSSFNRGNFSFAMYATMATRTYVRMNVCMYICIRVFIFDYIIFIIGSFFRKDR